MYESFLPLNVKISINKASFKVKFKCVEIMCYFVFIRSVAFQAEVQVSRVQAAFCQQSENREKELKKTVLCQK